MPGEISAVQVATQLIKAVKEFAGHSLEEIQTFKSPQDIYEEKDAEIKTRAANSFDSQQLTEILGYGKELQRLEDHYAATCKGDQEEYERRGMLFLDTFCDKLVAIPLLLPRIRKSYQKLFNEKPPDEQCAKQRRTEPSSGPATAPLANKNVSGGPFDASSDSRDSASKHRRDDEAEPPNIKRPRTEHWAKCKGTMTFEEVFQNGAAAIKRTIIDYPRSSGRWYIIRCEECDKEFLNRNPLVSAGAHIAGKQHGKAKDGPAVIEHCGFEVRGCTEALAKQNNAAAVEARAKNAANEDAEYGYSEEDDFSDLFAAAGARPRQHSPSARGRKSHRGSEAILDPVPGEIYTGFWTKLKRPYAVLLLPSKDLHKIGIPDSFENLFELDKIPKCRTYNRKTGELGWAEGYDLGEAHVRQRKFPVLFFDKPKFPDMCGCQWLSAGNLAVFDLKGASASDIPNLNAVRWYLRQREARLWEANSPGSPCEANDANGELSTPPADLMQEDGGPTAEPFRPGPGGTTATTGSNAAPHQGQPGNSANAQENLGIRDLDLMSDAADSFHINMEFDFGSNSSSSQIGVENFLEAMPDHDMIEPSGETQLDTPPAPYQEPRKQLQATFEDESPEVLLLNREHLANMARNVLGGRTPTQPESNGRAAANTSSDGKAPAANMGESLGLGKTNTVPGYATQGPAPSRLQEPAQASRISAPAQAQEKMTPSSKLHEPAHTPQKPAPIPRPAAQHPQGPAPPRPHDQALPRSQEPATARYQQPAVQQPAIPRPQEPATHPSNKARTVNHIPIDLGRRNSSQNNTRPDMPYGTPNTPIPGRPNMPSRSASDSSPHAAPQRVHAHMPAHSAVQSTPRGTGSQARMAANGNSAANSTCPGQTPAPAASLGIPASSTVPRNTTQDNAWTRQFQVPPTPSTCPPFKLPSFSPVNPVPPTPTDHHPEAKAQGLHLPPILPLEQPANTTNAAKLNNCSFLMPSHVEAALTNWLAKTGKAAEEASFRDSKGCLFCPVCGPSKQYAIPGKFIIHMKQRHC